MGRTTSREESEIARKCRKAIPFDPDRVQYRGNFTQDEIYRRTGGYICKYCGQRLIPFSDHGNYDISTCETMGCPNNINSRLKFDSVESMDDRIVNNTNRQYIPWQSRRIL